MCRDISRGRFGEDDHAHGAAIAAITDAPPAETAGASGGGAVFVVGGGDYSGAVTAYLPREDKWRALTERPAICRNDHDLLVIEGVAASAALGAGFEASTRALLLIGGRAQFDAAGNYNKWQFEVSRPAASFALESRACDCLTASSVGDRVRGFRTAQPSIEICDADGLLSGASGWKGLTTIPVAPALDGWHACFVPV